MNIAEVQRGERDVTLTWADHTVAEIPFIWLRDHDSDARNPDTRERILDRTSIDIDISLDSFKLAPGEMAIFDNRRILQSRIRVLSR